MLESARHVICLAQMGCKVSNALPGYGCYEGPIDERQIEDILTIEKLLIKELRSQGIAVDMLRSQRYWDANLGPTIKEQDNPGVGQGTCGAPLPAQGRAERGRGSEKPAAAEHLK